MPAFREEIEPKSGENDEIEGSSEEIFFRVGLIP